jgi:hypothetical protein
MLNNQPKKIEIGDSSSGIQVVYVKSKKRISLFGWYDHYVGIQGGSMPIKEFCEKLNITAKDLL